MRLERGDKISIKNGDEEISAEVSGFFLGPFSDDATLKIKNMVDIKTRRTAQEVAMEWAGRLDVGVVVVRPHTAKYHRCECSVCGKKLHVTEMALRDMTPDQRDHYQVIRYKDLSRPMGDHLRHVHHTCLDKLATGLAQGWPSGLFHVGPPKPDLAARRQSLAISTMKTGGVDNISAHRAAMWMGDKEPSCIADLLDAPKDIELGARVITPNGEGIALEPATGRLQRGIVLVSVGGKNISFPRHLVRAL